MQMKISYFMHKQYFQVEYVKKKETHKVLLFFEWL